MPNSLQKVDTDLAFTAYPNSVVNQQVFINGVEGESILSVTDMTGRIVHAETRHLQNGQVVSLPNLTTGMYLLSIANNNKKSTKKLFVQ